MWILMLYNLITKKESDIDKRVGYVVGLTHSGDQIWHGWGQLKIQAGCERPAVEANPTVGVENKDDANFKQGGDVTEIGEWDIQGSIP